MVWLCGSYLTVEYLWVSLFLVKIPHSQPAKCLTIYHCDIVTEGVMHRAQSGRGVSLSKKKHFFSVEYLQAFGRTSVVLNSFETIYEGLVTQANNFAGRIETYRVQAFVSHCPDVLFGDFNEKWVYMKKTAMQVLKVRTIVIH